MADVGSPLLRQLRHVPRRLAGRGIRASVGTLPWFAFWLRARRPHLAAALLVREAREARRLRRAVGGPVTAAVVTVIPTHRRPEPLLRAVRSALAQTVDDHHVLVVDDGAGLPPLPDHPRLTAVSLRRNVGTVGVVRNVGIRLSRSSYLAFLDDDNTWAPTHLEVALGCLAEGADLVCAGLRRVTGDGQEVDVLAGPVTRAELRERSTVDASAIVARRRPGVRFARTPCRYGEFPREDWELVWRLGRSLRVVRGPEVTVTYVVHDDSRYTAWVAGEGGG